METLPSRRKIRVDLTEMAACSCCAAVRRTKAVGCCPEYDKTPSKKAGATRWPTRVCRPRSISMKKPSATSRWSTTRGRACSCSDTMAVEAGVTKVGMATVASKNKAERRTRERRSFMVIMWDKKRCCSKTNSELCQKTHCLVMYQPEDTSTIPETEDRKQLDHGREHSSICTVHER
eukprot:scaffold23_cov175-Amphora_coffeaeformis.AAC.3